jgi:hypothetical protein
MSTKQRTLINEPILSGLQINGELVVWNDRHLDFAALQQRLHPSASRAGRLAVALPACFVVFDLLARSGVDLRTRPYRRRRYALEKLLARHLRDRVALMPMTTDLAVAQLWMVDHCAAGIEGVVAKRLDQTYRPGGRTWRKVRTRTTAEAVVGGVLGPVVQPDTLIVGCRDTSGRLRVSGRTTPLSPSARATMTTCFSRRAPRTRGPAPSRPAALVSCPANPSPTRRSNRGWLWSSTWTARSRTTDGATPAVSSACVAT